MVFEGLISSIFDICQSNHFHIWAKHFHFCLAVMSNYSHVNLHICCHGMAECYACTLQFLLAKIKRAAATVDGTDLPCQKKKAKCQISMNTFEKWQQQLNRKHETLPWLQCLKDKQNRSLVEFLWCEDCRKYESRIYSSKNFSKVDVCI